MQEPQTGAMPPAQEPLNGSSAQSYAAPPYTPQHYPPSGYPPQPGGYVQPPYPTAVPAGQGLSDTAAGALAYITIIPAIVFLVLAPYNTRPFVKFHAVQCLGLAVVWFCLGVIGIIPILGWLVVALGSLALLVVWILSIVKASQGSYLKLPVLSDFASQQSGYPVA